MAKLTQAQIDELRTSTPHCVWSDVFAASGDDAPPAEVLKTVDDYLQAFAPYKPNCPCLGCGTKQDDGLMSVFFGGFKWGLVHGEGFCEICGWPARAYHTIKDDTGTLARFTRILQYHPDGIDVRERAKEAVS